MIALVFTCLMALGSAAGLATGLVSCVPAKEPADRPRPLNAVEAGRLATMRLHNYQDGRVGVRGGFGNAGQQIQVAGWIDWQRPLIYLSVTGPRQDGPDDGLVQAMPGVVAFRPGRAAAGAGGQPPVTPPADGWRVRRFAQTGPDGAPLDTMLLLLFTIAVNQTDTADLLVRSEARWLGTDTVDGVPVDVLLGPAVPPRSGTPTPEPPSPTPTTRSAGPSAGPSAVPPAGPFGWPPASPAPSPGSLAAHGGSVRYWLDSDARLHRLEAVVGADSLLRLDFARADRRELDAVAELGGRTITPRRPTATEADTLARLRQRNRGAGGGALAITLPGPDDSLLTAAGWLDWRNAIAYLALRDTRTSDTQTLVWADRTAVAERADSPPTGDGRPPVPLPRDGWKRTSWEKRFDALGASDLDLLLNETIGLSGSRRDDPAYLRTAAMWLRTDVIGGTQVAVYEIPRPAEQALPPGNARLRYWIDSSGVLRRIEVRGRTGGYGRLDITLGGPPPYVGPVG